MWLKYLLIIFLLLLSIGPLWLVLSGKANLSGSWQSADRGSAHLAPDSVQTPEAVVQVYAARAINWRGLWGVHTWIAVKPAHAEAYTVYQVVGWWAWRGMPVVGVRQDIPDRLWYGHRPYVIAELRGEKAAAAINKIAQASAEYPYQNRYLVWPGPNSNTYVAYIARRVPELGLVLPSTAIGKDYLSNGSFLARAPSGTGYQLSLRGLLGITLARKEGLEVNLLSLALGVNPFTPALNLPGIGWISR